MMFYFGCGWALKAFDTFAASRDMVNWTVDWPASGRNRPSRGTRPTRKAVGFKHDGVVYHYYCAVGTEAASSVRHQKDLRAGEKASRELSASFALATVLTTSARAHDPYEVTSVAYLYSNRIELFMRRWNSPPA